MKYETKSAPKWLLDRAVKYIEKEGLIDEDDEKIKQRTLYKRNAGNVLLMKILAINNIGIN